MEANMNEEIWLARFVNYRDIAPLVNQVTDPRIWQVHRRGEKRGVIYKNCERKESVIER